MSRQIRIDRRFGRALFIGLGLSIGIHAALVALLRFEVTVDPAAERQITFADAPAPPEEAMQVVQFEGRLPDFGGGDTGESGGDGPTLAATAMPRMIPDSDHGMEVAAVASDERNYDALLVVDPLNAAQNAAVDITKLPEAQTMVATVPVYEPGSVGEAKRRWAREGGVGQAGGGSGSGTGWTIGGGDHCPVPGRIPGRFIGAVALRLF